MSLTKSGKKTAVHFGAGNIGRGFIGPLLSQSGYHVVFVDIQDAIVDALNKRDEYTVHILDQEERKETVTNTSAVKTRDPAVLQAIASADVITTSVGPVVLKKIGPTIAQGLSKRRQEENGEITVIACENMLGATSKLEEYVREALKEQEEDLEYLDDKVGFANCEVDRIVPPFEGDDPLEVGVEGFYEWVVEKNAVKGDLKVNGMQLKDDLEPFLERKLFTLNCGHAMLAFIGHVRGYTTVLEAMGDQEVQEFARKALYESGAALVRKHGFDKREHHEYIERTMRRYSNPNLRDELPRVSRNPLRKLSPNERLVGAVNMCKEYDLPRTNLLKGIAAAFCFDVKDDKEAVELMNLVKEKGIELTIEQTTQFHEGSEEFKRVLEDYDEMRPIAS